MGYICPYCGEGLPEDELCPCQAGPDDPGEIVTRPTIRGPLTAELDDPRSLIREFLGDRFGAGLRDVQRRYRQGAPALVIPRSDVNLGTVGTASDWLLRFLVHPQPDIHLALLGSGFIQQPTPALSAAVFELCDALGISGITSIPAPPRESAVFTGPMPGSKVDPELLTRGCWALALLTEFYRAGPLKVANSPLTRLDHSRTPDLLALATPAALEQLAQIRHVFETTLLPELAGWRGPWILGPTFAGSALVGGADADLIAAGLLLEVKTTVKRPSLGVTDLFQVIGYALLDLDDEYQISAVARFSARYAYLSVWQLGQLLDELAGQPVNLAEVRADFRRLLLSRSAWRASVAER